ncbi:MAG: hypothetical protein ACI4EH_08555 [Oliverpabstia sp.]
MEGLKDTLLKEKNRLENIIQITKEQLQHAPEGYLRITTVNQKISYYHCTKNNSRNGTYISRKNHTLIQQLAQKSYNQKVLQCAEKRLAQIEILVNDYDDHEIENIFHKEHVERKKLIQPVEPIWEKRLQEWSEQTYQGKGFKEGDPAIYTDRGERVRSKSEKILADYFYRHGISYKYEHPLYLDGLGVVYPDFSFLSPVTGSEIYWEHNGKMDEPVYARSAVKKIQAYERSNILVGKQLIVTYETEQTPLNTKTIEKMVDTYLRVPQN